MMLRLLRCLGWKVFVNAVVSGKFLVADHYSSQYHPLQRFVPIDAART